MSVLSEVQTLIGRAQGFHANDRDRHGHEKGQACLKTAFELCVEAQSYDPISTPMNIKIVATGLRE